VLHLQTASPNRTASPTIIDAHVGYRIRLRRMSLGLPMTQLAKHLGVSWQQLRKYEQARDRISASMLYLIASALKVTVDSFFDDLQQDETDGSTIECSQTAAIVDQITRDARGQRISHLIASYWRIEDAKQRRHVLGLMHALADQAPNPDTKPCRDNPP
jgi:transcriptional regulator with XRE-family HTH domain